MQPVATDRVALSVCWSWPWALQKWRKQSWCHSGC